MPSTSTDGRSCPASSTPTTTLRATCRGALVSGRPSHCTARARGRASSATSCWPTPRPPSCAAESRPCGTSAATTTRPSSSAGLSSSDCSTVRAWRAAAASSPQPPRWPDLRDDVPGGGRAVGDAEGRSRADPSWCGLRQGHGDGRPPVAREDPEPAQMTRDDSGDRRRGAPDGVSRGSACRGARGDEDGRRGGRRHRGAWARAPPRSGAARADGHPRDRPRPDPDHLPRPGRAIRAEFVPALVDQASVSSRRRT